MCCIAGDMVAVLAVDFDDGLFLDDSPPDRKQNNYHTFQVLSHCKDFRFLWIESLPILGVFTYSEK